MIGACAAGARDHRTQLLDFTQILHGFYTHFLDPDDNNTDYSHTPIFNTSKYVGAASVDFDLPGARWVGQLGTNFQGPYTPFEEKGILRPGYALFNVGGGFKIDAQTQLVLGVRNLFDTGYRELESGGQAVPGQPRTIYAGVRYRGK